MSRIIGDSSDYRDESMPFQMACCYRLRPLSESRVRTKPLARRTQPRACLRVQPAVASVTERSFCDRTTKANAGRAPASQLQSRPYSRLHLGRGTVRQLL